MQRILSSCLGAGIGIGFPAMLNLAVLDIQRNETLITQENPDSELIPRKFAC